MLNTLSASKCLGQDEKQSGQIRRQPLREHELLGIPKMTDAASDRPRLQPIRIKDLSVSVDLKKSSKDISDRRKTTMANPTNSVRRKLYNEPPRDQASCSKSLFGRVDKTILSIAEDKKSSESVYLAGLSKSDGKISKSGGLGRERLQPERMKVYMELWEKSQTVQPSAPKSRSVETRSHNVRRKLYSTSNASPTTLSKNNPKYTTKSQAKSQKACIVGANIAKCDARKSVKPEISNPPRKSCLLPPNSIRDKYVNFRPSDTIMEESTLTNASESETTRLDCTKIQNNENIDSSNAIKLCCETVKSSFNDVESSMTCDMDVQPEVSKISVNDEIKKIESSISNEMRSIVTKKCDKIHEERMNNEITRPSVIMGISAKEIRNEQQIGSNDNEKSSIASISRLPLQELKNDSLPRSRFDATDASPDELPGNASDRERGESMCYENLPRNSFFESSSTNSFVSIERQTLAWMHGNLKLNVQSMEEQLFSMKLLLKTLEDAMKNHDNSMIRESKLETNDPFISSNVRLDMKKIDDTEPKVCQTNDADQRVAKNLLEIPSTIVESSIENVAINRESLMYDNFDDENKENSEKSGEKPRRRSLRLAEKLSKTPKCGEDSFSRMERELDIIHAKTRTATPRILKSEKHIDPRNRKSIREFMALKSTMNCLATPGIKGFPTPKSEKDTPSHSRMTRRSLSRKLLAELDDLYDESPA